MAQFQYNHQWTPLHPYPHNGYNTQPPWNNAGYMRPQQQYSYAPSFSYKPAAMTTTFEVEDDRTPINQKDQIPDYRKQTFMQRWFGGLKRTLRLFVLLAVIILLINVGWLAYAYSHYEITPARDGHKYGTIQSGNCKDIKRANTWLHLGINIMSTLLLAGNNAFMAAYSGPTRQEVDQAHARRKWLHVGSMSLRNMFGIAKRKSLVCLLLAISSAPFHLLYNSVAFASLATNNYYWTVVTEDFLTGAPYNLTGPPSVSNFSSVVETNFYLNASLPDDTSLYSTEDPEALDTIYDYFDNMQNDAHTWEKLSPKSCITAYANAFISGRRNVILVSSTKNATNSILQYGSADLDTALDHNWWICSEQFNDGGQMTCTPEQFAKNASADIGTSANVTTWSVYDFPIEYCLSETVDNVCSVKFSLDIMVILLSFTALKVLAMIWILLRIDAEHILTSVGDAAASFIKDPDPNTLGMCLANKRHLKSFWRSPGLARLYNGAAHRRWGYAVSWKRWITFTLILALAFFLVFIAGILGFENTKSHGVSLSLSSLWSLGFGTVSQYAMVLYGGGGNPVTTALLANAPQVALAIIYLVYQGIVTAMFTAADWAKFGSAPQTLMVSTPVGKQRGTWLLGAPLAYGVVLLALQTLLHWFVSQSMFVVQLTVNNKLGNPSADGSTYSNCGYSPIAIICSVAACLLLFATAIIFWLRSTPVGSPPIVSTCSAAISAACHVPNPMRGDHLVYSKLRWGVTDVAPNGIGHCSLGLAEAWNRGRASQPVTGCAYAGTTKMD